MEKTQPTPTQNETSSATSDLIPDWEHRDLDDSSRYYSDASTQDPLEWEIKTDSTHPEDTPTDANTEPITENRRALEAVERATTLEEALRAYEEAYSLDKIEAGKQSPQLCAKVLLRINDKFAGQMSLKQAEAVALETIAVGEAIGHLAEVPDSASIDRTSLDGLTYMAKIIDYAQTYAPDEMDTLEKGILKVAERIDSRAGSDIEQPVSVPIQAAINELKHLPASEQQAIPFTRIVTRINGDIANRTEPHVMATMAEHEAEERKKAAASRKLAEVATGALNPLKRSA